MKTRRKYKPRNINMEARTFCVWSTKGTKATKIIHAGDSLHTVACPNCISKGMRQNLRRVARRSQVVFPKQRKIAREIMAENKIPSQRMASK